MKGVFLAIACAAHAFTVNGHYALNTPGKAAQPLVAGLLQCFGVDESKHPREGVMGGDAVG